MGMNRSIMFPVSLDSRVPRVYGDEPGVYFELYQVVVSSPCVWG